MTDIEKAAKDAREANSRAIRAKANLQAAKIAYDNTHAKFLRAQENFERADEYLRGLVYGSTNGSTNDEYLRGLIYGSTNVEAEVLPDDGSEISSFDDCYRCGAACECNDYYPL